MKNILEIERISKTYDKTVKALTNLNFAIDTGITAIIGPNGAGKTTLFNIISGTVKPTYGRIRFYGKDITNYPPHKRCKIGIGRTFQIPHLFENNSVLENVAIGVMESAKDKLVGKIRKQSEEILNFVGIEDNKLNMKAKKLTLSEQKTLQLAMAVATSPKLMLLDELSSGMTLSDAIKLITPIKRLREKGVSFFMVEHNIEIVNMIAERIIVINEGQVVRTYKR